MANSNSDLGLIYNHPSIISTITNNDTIFTSTTGNRPFFCVIASEKGEDNKIKMISSVPEFVQKYGEPNLKKYGQQSYNVINILQNGETVYVLRVLPDNAGYSHAMLNLQTKVSGTKNILDSNGNIVQMDNVVIRPTVAYSKTNNTSKSLLEYELKGNTSATVDGYRNNPLFFVIPKGRGVHYDNYGFKIYLNPSYDKTYNFRVYNFEVVRFNEYNNPEVIEGPFYVSLYPDAMNESNQSMFITDIVNRYSEYFEVVYNEESYDYITSLINPNVDPAIIDILSGESRLVNNETETFFDEITMMNQDVHVRVHKYGDDGVVLTDGANPLTTYVDSSDEVEQSIISIDNTIRNEEYTREVVSLENMKNAISDIYTGLYPSSVNAIGALKEDVSPAEFQDETPVYATYVAGKESYNNFITSKEAFDNEKSEVKFAEAQTYAIATKSDIDNLMKYVGQLRDYCEVIKNDSNLLTISENIDNINTILDTAEIVAINLTSYKSKINSYISDVIQIKTLQSIEDEIAEIKIILSAMSSMLDYFKTSMGEEEANANVEYQASIEAYNKAIELIQEITSEFTPDAKKDEYKLDMYESVDTLLTQALVVCNTLILENKVDAYGKLFDTDGAVPSLITVLASVVEISLAEYTANTANATLKADMVTKAKETATSQQDAVSASKSNIYTTQLQNFDEEIRFRYGSDGDMDTSNLTLLNKTKENLFIKAYKGLVDDGITSKKIIPARFIIDANETVNVKNAMKTLVTEIRDDIFFYCDLGFTASPEDAIAQRDTAVNFSANTIGIYAQDFTVYDEYTGRDIQVTTPYFLAKKVPYCSRQFGLHYPIAGNRRGLLDGFKSISWIPNETYKEIMYNKQINYIESDTSKTRFGSQLTAEMRTTPLSNINNVITVMDIRNDVELIAENYQFEFNNTETISAFQSELDEYLSKYTSSKAAERLTASVYASDYDKLQKILRVSIEIKFYDIIERIVISLDVVKK